MLARRCPSAAQATPSTVSLPVGAGLPGGKDTMTANAESEALELVERLGQLLAQLPSRHPLQDDEVLLAELRQPSVVPGALPERFRPVSVEDSNEWLEVIGPCRECGAPLKSADGFDTIYATLCRDETAYWERCGDMHFSGWACVNGHEGSL